MRAFVLVAALAVVAVNAHPAKEERNGLPTAGRFPHNDIYSLTGQCIPNQHFIDQCNYCRCASDGKLAGCTLMACPPVKKVHIDGYRQGMKCLPGQTFYDECNSCVCGSDGVSAGCTLMACPGSSSRVTRSVSASANLPHIDNFWEIGECTPGQRFIDVCNTCVCSGDGTKAACTQIACPPVDVPRLDGYQQGKKCPAGKTFRDRCNTCHCGSNGHSALCTLIACQE